MPKYCDLIADYNFKTFVRSQQSSIIYKVPWNSLINGEKDAFDKNQEKSESKCYGWKTAKKTNAVVGIYGSNILVWKAQED